jgi:hypothetical protein
MAGPEALQERKMSFLMEWAQNEKRRADFWFEY